MDYRSVSAGLGVLCLLLVGFILFSGGQKAAVASNQTVSASEGADVFYLYPLRCVQCDLTKPGQCDYCTSYYDIRLMDMLGGEVGVPVEFYVSDAVDSPGVFVVKGGKATLGDARTKYNIANTLCRFAGVRRSCELFQAEMLRVGECVGKYGVGDDAIIYHTNSNNCPPCSRTDSVVEKLKETEYSDGVKYDVHSVDHAVDSERKLLTECLQAFDNINYAPQLLCPKTGRDLTGEFTLSQARDFADNCIEGK